MKRNIMVATCLAAIILAVIVLTVTNQVQRVSPCPEFMIVGPDGHYFLNRSLATPENADAINLCLRQAGINNVHIAKNLSELMPPNMPS